MVALEYKLVGRALEKRSRLSVLKIAPSQVDSSISSQAEAAGKSAKCTYFGELYGTVLVSNLRKTHANANHHTILTFYDCFTVSSHSRVFGLVSSCVSLVAPSLEVAAGDYLERSQARPDWQGSS